MHHAFCGRVLISAVMAAVLLAPNGSIADSTPAKTAEAITEAIKAKAKHVQLVTFPATEWGTVKVVRGNSLAKGKNGQAAEKAEIAEIVTFGSPDSKPVRVLRGDAERAPLIPRPANPMDAEMVRFGDLRDRPVSILRGQSSHGIAAGLFGPASAADLDRVAFAVDGAESSHGTDLGMWRAEPGGPQGPMQVSEAAAIDVGGGDRFDLDTNRILGRAYLARMYRRYGNWPDAIAAYNWGPGNVDAWIGDGRVAERLPLMVERYRERVLRDAARLFTDSLPDQLIRP